MYLNIVAPLRMKIRILYNNIRHNLYLINILSIIKFDNIMYMYIKTMILYIFHLYKNLVIVIVHMYFIPNMITALNFI